jgi:hypothetical protein
MPTYLHNDDGISRYRDPYFFNNSSQVQPLNCRQIFDHVSECPVCSKVFGMQTENHFVTLTPAKFFSIVAILIAIFVAVPAVVKRLVRKL